MDFSGAGAPAAWRAVDDAVMGGRSRSRMEAAGEGGCAFTGEVSLADGGGFASVRAPLAPGALAGASTLVLRCRGDGRTYKLRLLVTAGLDGVSYGAAFPTAAGEWVERVFPLVAFAPVRRGRSVPEAPALRAEDVRGVGLTIGDRQAGPFRLELAWLAAC